MWIELWEGLFLIKTGYKSKSLSPRTMKSLGSTKKDVDQDKDEENVSKLESVEVVLVNCNLVKSSYQQASKSLFTFAPNKKYGQLINISSHSLTILNTINTEFSFIEIWLTGQNSKQFEIDDPYSCFYATDDNNAGIKNKRKYFLPKALIKNHNVLIDGRNFYDQPINDLIKQYDEVRKTSIGQGDYDTKGCLLDYACFKDSYKLIVIDLNK